MKQIFSLSTKEFLSGLSPSAHITNVGLWHKAKGINPFVSPTHESEEMGLLQTGHAGTDIGSGVVTDVPLAAVSDVTGAGAGTLFVWGSAGNLYTVDLSGDNNAVHVNDNDNPATGDGSTGLFIFQAKGGTKLLYVVREQVILTWDMSGTYPTGWNISFASGLQDTQYHPTQEFVGDVYIGNKDRIARLRDEDGTPTLNKNVLDLPQNMLVTCLSDDGQCLVIGGTENQGDNVIRGHTRIFFWNTNANTWSRSWVVLDTNIISIRRVGIWLYALCGRGLYVFNYSTPPQKLLSIGTAFIPQFGHANAAATWNEGLLWGGGAPLINYYGKMHPVFDNAYHQPFPVTSGTPTLIVPDARFGQIFVGTASNKLYRYEQGDTGGATAIAPETVYIPLGDTYNVGRIDLVFGEPLASGDELDVSVQTDQDTAASAWGTASFTTYGSKQRVSLYNTKKDVENLKLILNFAAGNVKVKTINVYGDRQSQ